jgi:hypothetical protein
MPLLGFNHSETASKQVELMADMQAKPFRGLYRTVAWAYVTNGVMAFQVSEADYRGFEYERYSFRILR